MTSPTVVIANLNPVLQRRLRQHAGATSSAPPSSRRGILRSSTSTGGARAIGHPIGASGARVLNTLLVDMKRRGAEKRDSISD